MQTHTAHRILVVDNNQDTLEKFREALASDTAPADPSTPRFEVDCAGQSDDALELVTNACLTGRPFSVAFVDADGAHGWDGIQAIFDLWKADPHLQAVLRTALPDRSFHDTARPLPPADQWIVLTKSIHHLQIRQLAAALSEKCRLARTQSASLDALVQTRTAELQHSLSLAQASEKQYRLLFDSTPNPILTCDDTSLAFLSVNEAAIRDYGYSRDEFMRLTLRDLVLPRDLPAFLEKLSKPDSAAANSGIWRHRAKNGGFIEVEIISHHVSSLKIFLFLAVNVTARLNLEAQLRQSQKMDSVGQLAGGIAHDFNNLLTVINGHASLLLAGENLTPKGANSLKEISEAGKRAGVLTRQLMTFSRKQEFHPQVADLNDVINNVIKMLRRILGEDIALQTDLSTNLPTVMADLSMLEQVLLNLAVNSRDAMPRGGRLIIKTSSVFFDADAASQNPQAVPGHFACLSFTDNGCGIAPENLDRVFEPFFSTKERNRGTGLGLATVYGIIKQHQGWINVQSQQGQGAAFQIFLPASATRGDAIQTTPAEQKVSAGTKTIQKVTGGTETILVVESEAPLLKFIHHILESHGYKVLGCSNGRQALDIWRDHRKKIDLLLTDLVLPDGMAGMELARLLQEAKPALKILHTTDFNAARLAKEFPAGAPANLIQKPFHASRLAEMVFKTLNPHP